MPKKPDKDGLRLLDMRDAADDAINIAGGQTRADIENSRTAAVGSGQSRRNHRRSCESCQRRNEGACPGYRLGKDIVGMRNKLVHAYWKVNYDVLWEVISDKLPPLVTELNRLIEAEYGAQDG